jgi:hypothetical protein
MADVSGRQNLFLQSLAIRELEAQKVRIETYQVQARYELAAIYDRTSNGPAKAPPSAPPNVTPETPPNAAPDAPPNPPPNAAPNPPPQSQP